jgi:hypothetical protein
MGCGRKREDAEELEHTFDLIWKDGVQDLPLFYLLFTTHCVVDSASCPMLAFCARARLHGA